MDEARDRRREQLVLALVLLVAFVARWWLLGQRWVNPDEGAHLMDGRLALQGLVPGVDFVARQIVYVWLEAATLKLLGIDYVHARLLAVAATVGGGWFLYLIGRELFDRTVGLLASILYLFLPFSFILSMNAKTEPVSIFFAAGAVYFAIDALRRADRGEARRRLVAAGTFLSAAFYVRQSAMGIGLALVLTLLIGYRGSWKRAAAGLGWTMLGAVSVWAVVSVYYGLAAGTLMLRNPSVNPLIFLLDNARSIDFLAPLVGHHSADALSPGLGLSLPASPAAAQVHAGRNFLHPTRTLHNLTQSVELVLVLAAGSLLAAPIALWTLVRRRGKGSAVQGALSYATPYLWLVCVAAAYAFWALHRGFFQAYLLELIPPMALLSAALVVSCVRFLRDGSEGWSDLVPALGTVLALWLVPLAFGLRDLNRPVYLSASILTVGAWYLGRHGTAVRWAACGLGIVAGTAATLLIGPSLPGPVRAALYLLLWGGAVGGVLVAASPGPPPRVERALALALYPPLLAAVVMTALVDRDILDLGYDCVWAPSTVQEVSTYVREHSAPGDEVMSGAVIWALQADRDPFYDISHPLQFLGGMTPAESDDIGRYFAHSPPKFIVLDGYTRALYVDDVPTIQSALSDRYVLRRTVEGSRYPVKVYERGAAAGPADNTSR